MRNDEMTDLSVGEGFSRMEGRKPVQDADAPSVPEAKAL